VSNYKYYFFGESLKSSHFYKFFYNIFAQVRNFYSTKRFLLKLEYVFKQGDYRSIKNRVKIWLVLRSIFAQTKGFLLKQK